MFVGGSGELKETGANAVRKALKIEEGQEVNRLELAVDGWRTAQAPGNIEISAKEARGPRRVERRTI